MTDSREIASPPPLNDIDRMVHEPARLMILANLYVLESADFTFLMNQTNLTWGNLSSHLSKLEEAGYVHIEKEFVNKKPHTMISLTEDGRKAFERYRQQMKEFMDGFK
jgi:DNA-binding MarR family transcriptional regulator